MIYVEREWFLTAAAVFAVVNFTFLRYSKDGDITNAEPVKELPATRDAMLQRLRVLVTTPDVTWNVSLGIALIGATAMVALKQSFGAWCMGVFLLFFVQDAYVRWKTAHRTRRHVVECERLLDALK